jgi:two-component system sensor histidine kinase KdpD
MALEVDRLQENAKKVELEMETERLRNALLSSVSHDFRTPLTAIVGSAGTLLQKGSNLDKRQTRELLENIQSEGDHLSRLVQNLLEATRLEAGGVHVKKELYPLEEVLGSALGHLEKSLKGRDVDVKLPENLPSIPMDCLLMEQVFVNLLENAIRHTPPTSGIEVSAKIVGNT